MRKLLALLLCALLAVMSPFGAASRAETAHEAAHGEAPVYYSHNGRVTLWGSAGILFPQWSGDPD